MARRATLGQLILVHWHEEEANELAAELRTAGWKVQIGMSELREVKTNPPTAVAISLRRLPSHGREVADALWYTKWGRAIPIVFFDGQPDKVEAARIKFPDARFVNWTDLPSELQRIADKQQPPGMPNPRGSQLEIQPDKVKTEKSTSDGRVTVENVNVPGYTTKVDAAKYEAMRRAILAVLPKTAPGLTQTEIRSAVLTHLPEALFPAGAKAPWWAKTVQLDLEAKGSVRRDATVKPLRWYKVAPAQRRPDPSE